VVKRRDLIKRISRAAQTHGLAFEVRREGARHTVYDLDGLMIPIERHSEIDNWYEEKVYKECEPKLGRRWWT
jgi:alpha-L-fucosidase